MTGKIKDFVYECKKPEVKMLVLALFYPGRKEGGGFSENFLCYARPIGPGYKS